MENIFNNAMFKINGLKTHKTSYNKHLNIQYIYNNIFISIPFNQHATRILNIHVKFL